MCTTNYCNELANEKSEKVSHFRLVTGNGSRKRTEGAGAQCSVCEQEDKVLACEMLMHK